MVVHAIVGSGVVEHTEPERRAVGIVVAAVTTARALAQRSRIMLLVADGLRCAEIATRLGVHRNTVARWRRRFEVERLDGLVDEPRPSSDWLTAQLRFVCTSPDPLVLAESRRAPVRPARNPAAARTAPSVSSTPTSAPGSRPWNADPRPVHLDQDRRADPRLDRALLHTNRPITTQAVGHGPVRIPRPGRSLPDR